MCAFTNDDDDDDDDKNDAVLFSLFFSSFCTQFTQFINTTPTIINGVKQQSSSCVLIREKGVSTSKSLSFFFSLSLSLKIVFFCLGF